MIQSRFVFLDQPPSPRWSSAYHTSMDAAVGYFAGMWNYYPPNLSGVEIGVGGRSCGVIRMDNDGRLVFQEGTNVRMLRANDVRKPVPLNLLDPELRRPS